ncbi:hypothetical protein BH24ACI3_BH24ACI3_03830 [soil metagenome]
MNVFEDLIEELKEENLLESTVMDADEELLSSDVPSIVKPQNQREFLRKRAAEEVLSMQMVEHVLSGVEREHMKKLPVAYNDLVAKKALHTFLQATGDLKSQECADAEFELLQETQKWHGFLAERDKNISVANIRRFCEDSRPALSSQALISLARFYRNSPFSESVRGKFDFIMTRLFSREIEGDQRKELFVRSDMVGHIRTLYENWSSINLFSFNEHATEFALAVTQFEDFASETESAASLDDLLARDILERIRAFKEGLAEMFFAEDVVAAAIDCNLRVGNRFVELIIVSRSEGNPATLEEKYGDTLDHAVSSTTGKTLSLLEILYEGESEHFTEAKWEYAKPIVKAAEPSADKEVWLGFDLFGVNRWLLGLTLLVCIISVGIYFGADKWGGSEASALTATDVPISDTELKQHLQLARSSSETLYAVTESSWDALTKEQQKQFLSKLAEYARQIGLRKVNLLNNKGRSVAFADDTRLHVIGAS